MKTPDERIISALLSNSTNKEAAAACGLSEKQLYRRMDSPTFKVKLAEARARLVDIAVTALEGRMAQAVDTMTEIMGDKEAPPQTRLNAADAVIRNSLKLSERGEVLDRLAAIEKQMQDNEL